jgi:hypothetical protein
VSTSAQRLEGLGINIPQLERAEGGKVKSVLPGCKTRHGARAQTKDVQRNKQFCIKLLLSKRRIQEKARPRRTSAVHSPEVVGACSWWLIHDVHLYKVRREPRRYLHHSLLVIFHAAGIVVL